MKPIPFKSLVTFAVFIIVFLLCNLTYWLLTAHFFEHPASIPDMNTIFILALVIAVIIAILAFVDMADIEDRELKKKKD